MTDGATMQVHRRALFAIGMLAVGVVAAGCGGGSAASGPAEDLAFVEPSTDVTATPDPTPEPTPAAADPGVARAELVAIDGVRVGAGERRSIDILINHVGPVEDVRINVAATGATVVADGVSLVRLGDGEQQVTSVEIVGTGEAGELTITATPVGSPDAAGTLSVALEPATADGAAPEAVDNRADAVGGRETVVYVVGDDTDPDGDLDYSSMELVGGGFLAASVVAPGDGTIVYTPFADAAGTDHVLYRICDAEGRCDTAVLRVSVTS
ncbi:MAG: hypothetical protein KDB21_03605 [Acidimicrobiales bacterium]|nr:hypothetical protein [Acidimicrobiales bacterium]